MFKILRCQGISTITSTVIILLFLNIKGRASSVMFLMAVFSVHPPHHHNMHQWTEQQNKPDIAFYRTTPGKKIKKQNNRHCTTD